MPPTTRRAVLVLLLALGILGAVLVVSAPEEGPALTTIVTEEGLATRIPEGWERTEQFAFEFRPPTQAGESFDRWTVARACGPEGCTERSLGEWLTLSRELPTFTAATASDSALTIVRDETLADHRVLETRTIADTTIVFVAAFRDGADFYVECGVSVGITGDERLVDEVVDVCRETEAVVGG